MLWLTEYEKLMSESVPVEGVRLPTIMLDEGRDSKTDIRQCCCIYRRQVEVLPV